MEDFKGISRVPSQFDGRGGLYIGTNIHLGRALFKSDQSVGDFWQYARY
jgi:hypothetical protein